MISQPISGQLLEAKDFNNSLKNLKDSADLIKDSLGGNDPKTAEDVAKQFEEIFIFYMLIFGKRSKKCRPLFNP